MTSVFDHARAGVSVTNSKMKEDKEFIDAFKKGLPELGFGESFTCIHFSSESIEEVEVRKSIHTTNGSKDIDSVISDFYLEFGGRIRGKNFRVEEDKNSDRPKCHSIAIIASYMVEGQIVTQYRDLSL